MKYIKIKQVPILAFCYLLPSVPFLHVYACPPSHPNPITYTQILSLSIFLIPITPSYSHLSSVFPPSSIFLFQSPSITSPSLSLSQPHQHDRGRVRSTNIDQLWGISSRSLEIFPEVWLCYFPCVSLRLLFISLFVLFCFIS